MILKATFCPVMSKCVCACVRACARMCVCFAKNHMYRPGHDLMASAINIIVIYLKVKRVKASRRGSGC